MRLAIYIIVDSSLAVLTGSSPIYEGLEVHIGLQGYPSFFGSYIKFCDNILSFHYDNNISIIANNIYARRPLVATL